MIDLFTGLQAGVTAALNSAGGPKAFSAMPQNITPPYFVVADMDTDSEAAKGSGQFERMTIEVHTITRASERDSLLRFMHQGREVLDDQPLTAEGASFTPLRFVRASVSRAGPDGVTYLGISVFETFGQPA